MRPRILNRDIVRAVCTLWPVTLDELQGGSRVIRVVEARQAAYWLGVVRGGHSRSAVARFYGRDHTTIGHGLDAANRRRAADPVFARRLAAAIAAVALMRPRPGPDTTHAWPAPMPAIATFQSFEVLG